MNPQLFKRYLNPLHVFMCRASLILKIGFEQLFLVSGLTWGTRASFTTMERMKRTKETNIFYVSYTALIIRFSEIRVDNISN